MLIDIYRIGVVELIFLVVYLIGFGWESVEGSVKRG